MSQLVAFFLLLILCSVFLGEYCGKVMNGEKSLLSPILRPLERFIYRLLHVREEEMSWKSYALCAVLFNVLGMAAIFFLCLFQGALPLNPEGIPGMNWDLALNTALNFATNTDWQAYSGETQVSYLTQMLALENPNQISNFFEMFLILLFPMASVSHMEETWGTDAGGRLFLQPCLFFSS